MTIAQPQGGTTEGIISDEIPWIISVDDHVVEPPSLWQDRLTGHDREVAPHVVPDTCQTIYDPMTRAVRYIKGGEGPVVDWWVYENSTKPVPMVVACAGYPFEQHTIDAIAYADMRPGCYDAKARLADMDMNHTERSLCFPYVTRFAGQWFLEADDKGLALRCVQAYNDWMVDEWCGDSAGRLIPLGIVPLWDAELAATEVRRNAARGMRAITFTEMPSNLGLPSIHDPSRFWDPLFRACDETGTVICMHIGSGSKMADVTSYGSPSSRSPTARARSGGCRSSSNDSTRCSSMPSTRASIPSSPNRPAPTWPGACTAASSTTRSASATATSSG
jgi:hypothetical protein